MSGPHPSPPVPGAPSTQGGPGGAGQTPGDAPLWFGPEVPESLVGALRRAVDCFPGPLCDRCLGRLVGRMEPRGEPAAKGRRLRRMAGFPEPERADACAWCEGLLGHCDRFAGMAAGAMAGYGYTSFLVATRMHPDVTGPEQQADALLEQAGWPVFEPLKTELNREVGAVLSRDLDARVDLSRPDIVVQIDPYYDEVEVRTSSLYLYGRYRKLDRTIPQTRWPCRACKGEGRGCKACEGTGQQYADSVESLVDEVPRRAFGAPQSSFHGAGREDIDALMLGTGRPFVLELKQPRWREPRDPSTGIAMGLDRLQEQMNDHADGRVEVLGLRWSKKAEVAAVKGGTPDKAYRAHVVAESGVPRQALIEAMQRLTGTEVAQQTPRRVVHRRADKVRRRRVHEVRLVAFGSHREQGGDGPGGGSGTRGSPEEPAASDRFTLEVKAAAGTYIKELVSGDEGRTVPSLAGLVGVAMVVSLLDVLAVEDP